MSMLKSCCFTLSTDNRAHRASSQLKISPPENFLATPLKSLTCSEPKLHFNGHFGHSGQSEVTENGPNRFPMPKNLGIDIKIKSVACSEPKLQFWPIQTWPKFPKWPFWPLRSIWGVWKWSQSISHAQKPGDRHQNQVPNMFRTQVTIFLEPELQFKPFYPISMAKMAILATQVNLR